MNNPTVKFAPKTNLTKLADMKDGDIGIIRAFPYFPEAVGCVVQRYKDNLVTIGRESDRGWTDYFKRSVKPCNTVELLKEGDSIILS